MRTTCELLPNIPCDQDSNLAWDEGLALEGPSETELEGLKEEDGWAKDKGLDTEGKFELENGVSILG